jgi:anti-anti-sigma factor
MTAGPPPDFSLQIDDRDDRLVVAARGELDLATAPEFEDAIAGAISAGRHVVLDLRALEFMDSSGVRVLVTAHTGALEAGGRLSVAPGAADGPIARILGVSGLDSVLELVADPDA